MLSRKYFVILIVKYMISKTLTHQKSMPTTQNIFQIRNVNLNLEFGANNAHFDSCQIKLTISLPQFFVALTVCFFCKNSCGAKWVKPKIFCVICCKGLIRLAPMAFFWILNNLIGMTWLYLQTELLNVRKRKDSTLNLLIKRLKN